MICRWMIGASLAAVALTGCDWMPGKPKPESRWQPPTAEKDFRVLFAKNCRGCHGDDETVSGAISLNNPTYLAVVPKDKLRDIIVHGIPGTLMPGFSEEQGGMLTNAQIGILVKGIMAWAPEPLPTGLPPYAAPPGDASKGELLYAAYTDAIRQAVGEQSRLLDDGFLTNPDFLGLVSDQYLRTLILAGRPELGIADFSKVIPGRPLTHEEISDLVAWLISQRKNEFGQPLVPATEPAPPPAATETIE